MIETQRLTLRRLLPVDLAAMKVLLGDDEVMASSESGPLSREEVETWLRNEIDVIRKNDITGRLAVIRKTDAQTGRNPGAIHRKAAIRMI